jgi:aspartyl-tRNA(Asn)/glutamyl-tRNA(Gln) amidotransferase subunit A
MSADADVANLTLEALSEAIRERRMTSTEATRACLAQIEAWQPHSNCFINWSADEALAAAAAADEEIAAGRMRGPLHGIPVAFKDMFARAGKRVTFGSRLYANHVATTTATAIERLERAGCVLLGGVNMGEFANSPTGHNAHFGDCRNPWNRDRITGGSSSGSGAATAARATFAALGSDTGGSIRLPAAICGVCGIKPTNGLVSRSGALPRSWTLDTIGPLARTVRDCALVLEAIAGPDPRDPTTLGTLEQRLLPHSDESIKASSRACRCSRRWAPTCAIPVCPTCAAITIRPT